MSVPRCPSCGYTKKDAQFHGDHRLCKNAGNAPWEKGHTSVPPAPPTIEEVARKTRANLQEGFRRAFEKLEAEPAPPAPAAPPAVKLEYQIPPVASTFVTYSDEMQDPEKCPICNGYHIGGCHRAPGAQETAEPVTAEVALLQSRLTHISFTVTGNDHALIDCDPKQVDALLKSYAETLTKESLEILGGRADLEKIRADIAEEKVARLNENYRMMSIRSEKAEAEIRNLHAEVARLQTHNKWAENMVQHYLRAGLLPVMSKEEALSFLGEAPESPNPYEELGRLRDEVARLEKELKLGQK